MLKKEYIEIVNGKPWKEMEDYFDGLPVANVDKVTRLQINTDDWIDFTVRNFEHAQQKWEEPKAHYSKSSNKWASTNNTLGRNKHNTFELNYGMNGDTNAQLKSLLGAHNINKLKADPDTILMRLIVKLPGHGIAWHFDDAGSYQTKFPKADVTKLKRLWFSIQDWKDGHAFQISKTILTDWKAGDVYTIPFGMGHASSNFGYMPQYTVSFTGVIND